jgi:PPOX class probable F420-dependent enzyme
MAQISDPAVQDLLTKPNHAVVSTLNEDGSIHSTVVWVSADDGEVAVNSAKGRKWPSNLERDPTITVMVYDQENPYEYVAITGKAHGTTDGADEHIDRLSQKYIGQDSYPFRQPGEDRVKYVVEPDNVRHQKQG